MPATAKKLKVDLSRLPELTNTTFYPLLSGTNPATGAERRRQQRQSVFLCPEDNLSPAGRERAQVLVVRKVKADLRIPALRN